MGSISNSELKKSSGPTAQITEDLNSLSRAEREAKTEMANQISSEIAKFLLSEGHVSIDDKDGKDLAVKKAVHKITSLVVSEKEIVAKERDLFKSVMCIMCALILSYLIVLYF